MPTPKHDGLPLLGTDTSDLEHLEVQRLVSLLRLEWLVYLEPHMDFERFRSFVEAEDCTLAGIVDRQYDASHIPKTLERLKTIGLDVDPEAIDEGETEEDVYLEMARLFTGMDRHQLRESI